MKLIALTPVETSLVYLVNPQHIAFIRKSLGNSGEENTCVYFINGFQLVVEENVEEVNRWFERATSS